MSASLRILITGGTGSLGHALVARLLAGNLSERICIYSRGEHRQADMREDFGDDGRLRWFIGDVRDRDRLRRAVEDCDVVIHAAALKRIEVGAYNALEMVKTNVLGGVNVVEAAMDTGVQKVLAISSDKAYQPLSPYGQSKALAESIFLNANNMRGERPPHFTVCRYGNVAGSAGSVIPRWREILKTSSVVPVTDADATRFWMTFDEATDLVLDTLATMCGGELVIPELPAYRLGDLALAMGAAGTRITGLPAWEKKHEGMRDGLYSNTVRRMSVDELKEELTRV